ncbi:histone-lysine N-methyltransferase SETMAR [Trichonephila clavipes]|nr:histone-lysine N-methyltransferase SETMAR [Trichonephila clavipes]
MSSDAVRINLNECMQKYYEYSERFFALLPLFGKKAVLEWCMKEGYQHLRVNHSLTFKNPETSAHTNSIEGTWSAIKRSLRNHAVHVEGEFDHYLAEYMWRRRRGHSLDDDVFREFLRAITTLYPPMEKDVPSRCSISQKLKIDHKTVLSQLSKVGFKKKLDVCVQHQLTPKNMMDRISICEALAKRNEIDLFLKQMVTGDEKWVTYDNTTIGQTLKSDIYYQQLDRLKLVTDQKRPELPNRRGFLFHQDNVTPHTSVMTHQKLWELGWKVLMHPPYSPDLVPNDYSLFLALQNFLSYKKLGSRVDCKNRLLEFFVNKG